MFWLKRHPEDPYQGRYRNRYVPSTNNSHERDNLPLTSRSYGEARVNCCLRLDECRWGLFKGKQAVVMYLITDLIQDGKYNFQHCTVRLSFTRDDPTAQDHVLTSDPMQPLPRTPSPALLQPPSPIHLKGADSIISRSIEAGTNLNVSAGPVTVGGNVGTTSSGDLKTSWKYKSHWEPNELHEYTHAQWTWEAHKGNLANDDVSRLYSGLALQHASAPFWVSCAIDVSLSGSLWGTRRFKSAHPIYTVTKIAIPAPLPEEDIQMVVNALEAEIQKQMHTATAVVLPPSEYSLTA